MAQKTDSIGTDRADTSPSPNNNENSKQNNDNSYPFNIPPQIVRLLVKTYSVAFPTVSYIAKFQERPLTRTDIMANNGIIDGELHRNDSYSRQWKSLAQVNKPNESVALDT